MINELKQNLKVLILRINVWRWILALIVLFFFTLSYTSIYLSYIYTNNSNGVIIEYFIGLYDDEYFICYILFFVLMLLASDIFNPASNNYEENIILKYGNRWKWHRARLINILILCMIIITTELLISLVISIVNGFEFSIPNTLIFSIIESLDYGNPTLSIILSLLFIYFRLVVMCLIIYAINLKSKVPLGILGVFAITLLDMFFYQSLDIAMSFGILPLEHTRILYTPGAYPAPIGKDIRIDYIYSLIYWVLWIIVMLHILKKIINKKDFIMSENKY